MHKRAFGQCIDKFFNIINNDFDHGCIFELRKSEIDL